MARSASRVPWSFGGSVYAVAVGALATAGFAASKTYLILLAGLLTLPSSLVSIPAFYAAYGLLTLLPGAASAQESSSSGFCAAGRVCEESSTGGGAAWLSYADGALGVLALVGAALVNVVVLRLIMSRRRSRAAVSPPRTMHAPTKRP
jgi:hypothetical protein